MSQPVRGIIHVHSDFSRDGLSSIADLAEFAREAGFQFVGLTDHAEDLSLEDRQCLRRECEKYSVESCVMIPGLEFRCDGDIHILALGITDEVTGSDAVAVTRQIVKMGGIAILAHPCRNDYRCPPELSSCLNGIEIWNAVYDGRLVPPLGAFRLLQVARGVNPAISGYGGADLHDLHRAPAVTIELRTNGAFSVNPQTVLQILKSGTFAVRGRYLAFDAHAVPNRIARSWLWAFRKFYEISKTVRNLALGEN